MQEKLLNEIVESIKNSPLFESDNKTVSKIYISGKITGTDDYINRFGVAELELIERGYIVINPAKVNAQLPVEMKWEDYMKMSLCMLSMCDTIYLLKGWEDSKGANIEYICAKLLNKKIMYEV